MEKKKIAFAVGEKYRGLANGEIFTVQQILEPGCYKTASGGMYYLPRPKIVFKTKNDKPVECSLAMAENLLLERISPAAPAPRMRLPTSDEYDALADVADKTGVAWHWGLYSLCQDFLRDSPIDCIVRGHSTSRAAGRQDAGVRRGSAGFRPAFEAPDAAVPDGTAIVVGTLYMGGEPVEVPRSPNWYENMFDYIPGAQLEMREALDDDAYQVKAIKVGNVLISDRVLIRNISWRDVQAALGGEKKAPQGLGPMRLPKSAEWDALDKISGGSNAAINWHEMFSWCQDADPLCPLSRAIRGFVSFRGITHRSADFRSNGVGFRPAVEAPEAMAEGTTMVIGTLYMNGMPVKVPQNPTWRGDVACYTPGARLEMREAVNDPAYQVRTIKAGSALIADRVLLRNISWNDLAAQGCVR